MSESTDQPVEDKNEVEQSIQREKSEIKEQETLPQLEEKQIVVEEKEKEQTPESPSNDKEEGEIEQDPLIEPETKEEDSRNVVNITNLKLIICCRLAIRL